MRADAEASIGDGADALLKLKRSVSSKAEERGVGAKLDLEREELAKLSPMVRVETIASLAERFKLVAQGTTPRGAGPDDTRWLAEFALRVASDPMRLEAWAGEHMNAGIDKLIDAPTLARAARFLVIAVDRRLEHEVVAGGLYAGWEWAP